MLTQRRRPLALPAALIATLLAGCATVLGTPDQLIQVRTLDASNKPIAMRCHVANAAADWYGSSPMVDLRIRRSSSDLTIECHAHGLVARGTAISRGKAMEAAALLLPGGSATIVFDYATGYLFSYPTWLELRAGQDLVFDANNELAGKPTPSVQASRP